MPGCRSFIWGVSPIKLGRYPLWWIPRGRGRVRGRLFFPLGFPPVMNIIVLVGLGLWTGLTCLRQMTDAVRGASWGYEDAAGFHLGAPVARSSDL